MIYIQYRFRWKEFHYPLGVFLSRRVPMSECFSWRSQPRPLWPLDLPPNWGWTRPRIHVEVGPRGVFWAPKKCRVACSWLLWKEQFPASRESVSRLAGLGSFTHGWCLMTWGIWSISSFRGWRLGHSRSSPLSGKRSLCVLGRDVPSHASVSYRLEGSRGPYAQRLLWAHFV